MIKYAIAEKDYIDFTCDGEVLSVKAYSQAVNEDVLLGSYELPVKGGHARLGRFDTGRDGAFLKYVAGDGSVRYCSHVAAEYTEDYPDPGTKKGLQIEDVEDAIKLGAHYAALNVSIGDYMMEGPDPEIETEEFTYLGKTYYINTKVRNANDRKFKELTDAGVIITLIMLSGKSWRRKMQESMQKYLLHPDYSDEANLSAFNTLTDDGVLYYQAWCAYLFNRYCGPSGEHGRVYGAIISNEVQSQWIWGNAGEKTCEEYVKAYTAALRTAYLAGASVLSSFRVYVSLDHFWAQSMDPAFPLRYYPGREVLAEINALCKREGDFFWSIAHHPYPQDLSKPDFWNDETATFSMDTMRVTFKNLEILAQWLREDCNLFEGARRRVILSEQGFNTKFTPESEILQACAFGRAYRKVMEIPEIDAFILYAHYDHYGEFGLNLGMWRRIEDETKPRGFSGTKPIYDLYQVIDSKDDTGKYVWERF